MCAISGIIGRKRKIIHGLRIKVQDMMNVQSKRGPDDSGIVFADANAETLSESGSEVSYAGLGFNRLSIRDISIRGHQPMLSKDSTSALLFNGEIYNCEDIKDRYLGGRTLYGQSDTEVILGLYEEVGFYKAVSILNGMFALVVFDAHRNALFLARDRMGIKPLYYHVGSDNVLFSSELKGILASGLVEARLDKDAFYESLMYGYAFKNNLVSGIAEVEPGEIVEMDLANGAIVRRHYWKIEEHLGKMKIQFPDAMQQCKDLLLDSVKRQMVSDVPLGCQLSGGVDSSLISFYMMKNRKCMSDSSLIRDKAISIVVPSSGLSEERYVDSACHKSGMRSKKGVLNRKWVVDNLPRAIWHLDGIPAFTNEIGILLLSEIAKEEMTVLLSGEGSDELFLGYERMCADPYMDCEVNLADCIPKDIINKILRTNIDADCMGIGRKQYYLSLVEAGMAPYERARTYELAVRLPKLLQRQDRMTMANSVENRVPFLDNEIIEFALSLPFDMLISRSYGREPEGKVILKDICGEFFGKEFAYRPKMGFGLPLREYIVYMKKVGLYDLYIKRMSERELINPEGLSYIYIHMMHHANSESVYSRIIWRIISLEVFIELFIEGRKKDGFQGK